MLHHNKWSNHDVELETGSGIIPVYYTGKSLVNCVMWCIGLELALLAKDPWQCLLTTDNPNGAPFVKYPEIIALLMSRRYRDQECALLRPRPAIIRASILVDSGTRLVRDRGDDEAGQAKALGITGIGKGHLAPGAEADIAIYPIDPDRVDPSRRFQQVEAGFSKACFTIKRGRVVHGTGR